VGADYPPIHFPPINDIVQLEQLPGQNRAFGTVRRLIPHSG
jgi:hypothetical protein